MPADIRGSLGKDQIWKSLGTQDRRKAVEKLRIESAVVMEAFENKRRKQARPKADGKYKGRAPTAQRKADDVKRLKAAGKTAEQIVVELGISRSSVFRALRAK